MSDSNILERNTELNKSIVQIASTFTRRKVVDALFSLVIALLVGVIVILLLTNYHLDNDIRVNDIRDIQLNCAHLSERNLYVECIKVGPPLTIGGQK